jgi:hypothetical protein
MQFEPRERLPRFLARLARILSLENAGWLQAMFDEVEHIEGRRERVLWSLVFALRLADYRCAS